MAVTSDRAAGTFIGVYSAVLYTVLLTAPVIGGALTAQFGLTPGELGGLFSLELGAFSLATLPAYLWLGRIDPRTATYACTAVFFAGNVVSGLLENFPLLVAVRVITSLAAGSITIVLLTLSARTANPGRAFGIFVVSQLAMGALILAVFPVVFAGAPVAAVYWTMAALGVLCLPVVRLLRGGLSAPEATGHRRPSARFALGLAGIFLFYIALSGVWTFMAGISSAAGTDLPDTSVVLSVATVAGIGSALIATLIGDSPRRRTYLLSGYAALTASIALLFGAPGLARFAVAAVVFKFAWTFLLPNLLTALAGLSSGTQVMNSTNLMIGGGFAIGPYLAGALVDATGGHTTMLAVSLAAVLLSTTCAAIISRPAPRP
ncbi:Predicted arabinose efflux permease, MFS family [Saccharopolyspora antimicrobica]|uniref:MFS family arabinose efflux permease n=1 Tax=Saccharopolyspora antimicrobica TaxID=455193 RepID=A0A1I4SM92_9PSEU|nr:MFS transporter [Saccharopolyspora antimicrobica]RKT87799.1 putative MFS family arabinose efflux permease [Saccharopolyspora antimicrobica]SFM65527.1 Predicted arabinose efflux permease, MFS family [Saccharopolyspora antimicrobica]